MSSIGASFARVYVQQKRCEEKMKRVDGVNEKRGVGADGVAEKSDSGCSFVRRPKIHPAGFASSGTAGKAGETWDNVA